jgi:ABC-type polysaccharide/polyol phosphate export permease
MNMAPLRYALHDLVQGMENWRIWILLGWQDIHLRYRRSTLGPFWITLSMAAMIYSMGFLYGQLFEIDLTIYYPYLATGIVTWTLIASLINDGTDALFKASGFIRQIKLPYSIYIFRMVTYNFIFFLHNFLAIIPILWFFNLGITPLLFGILLFNLSLLLLCGFCYGFILSLLGARFQDIKPIVTSVLQIFFLLTPVLWMPSMLPHRYDYFAEYNPFYQLVSLLREPLMGQIPPLFTYIYVGGVLVFGFIFMVFLLARTRHRIAFWL